MRKGKKKKRPNNKKRNYYCLYITTHSQLPPRVLYIMEAATSRVNDADFKRCWICLGSEDETPPNGIETTWKRPCKCNLVAHESCLLEWTSEVANGNNVNVNDDGTNNSNNRVPVCPQCKSVIHVIKQQSQLLKFRQLIESTNRMGYQFLIVSTIGGTLLCTIYTTLYTVGASSIRFICPTDLAMKALGIHIDGTNVRLDPLTWRRLTLIPALPIMLIFSSSRSKLMDVLSFLMPFALSDKNHLPWNFKGPRLTLALLPWARLCYHTIYDAIVDPFIQACALQLRPSQDPNNMYSGNNNDEFNIRLVIENEDDEDDDQPPPPQGQQNNNNNNNNGQLQQPEVAGGLINTLIFNSVEWLVELLDDDDNININNNNNNHNQNRRNPPPQSSNWIISARSLSLKIGNSLLLPLLSGMSGSILSSIPLFRKLIPDRFNRNIVGGLLVIGIRDVVNIVTAILRVRQESSRSVLEYNQLQHHNCIHHEN